MSPSAFRNTALSAGWVTKIVLVPIPQLILELSELLVAIAVRDNVLPTTNMCHDQFQSVPSVQA